MSQSDTGNGGGTIDSVTIDGKTEIYDMENHEKAFIKGQAIDVSNVR